MTRTTSRTTRAEQARATREHLIATTIDLVRRRSYGQATLFEVAKAAGVTPGALQHHFGSRAMLMLEVLQAVLQADGELGVPWPEASVPLAQRAPALVQALWTRLYAPPRFLAAWSVYFGAAGEADMRPRVVAMRRKLAEALHARFAAALPEARGHAAFEARVDLVLSALRGMGVVRLFGAQPRAERAQLEELAATIAGWCMPPAGGLPPPSKRPRRRKEPS